eukprot:8876069-Pyramimonas_sp.AAC.1
MQYAPRPFQEPTQDVISELAGMRGKIAITVEDKDPNTLWVQRPFLLLLRWLFLLSRASHRWRVCVAPRTSVVQWY